MNAFRKLVLVELCLFFIFPLVGVVLTVTFELAGQRLAGEYLFSVLVVLWTWELFAASHYRYARQEEFLSILQTAGKTQAPVESVLRAYLDDRPTDILYRSILLFFVFPGYYWIHCWRSFDHRLGRVVNLLERGVPLSHALTLVPGVASRETALAVAVGQFGGQLPESLARVPDRRLAPQWLELGTRLAYPLVVLSFLWATCSFVVIFIIPKFRRIFVEFKLDLPNHTERLVASSEWLASNFFLVIIAGVLLLVLINLLFYSSRLKWYFPLVGWIYRMQARGQFLQTLGMMIETGKPLPRILDCILESGLLPTAVAERADRVALDTYDGHPLAATLLKHGLVTRSMMPLVESAEKAQRLSWALQELGETLIRRSARVAYRIAMILFPLAIFAMAILIGLVAIALFTPMVSLLENVR